MSVEEIFNSAPTSPPAGSTNTPNEKKQETSTNQKEEAWGYDLYPERRGTFSPKISNILIGKEGKENIEKLKCEQNVVECVKDSK